MGEKLTERTEVQHAGVCLIVDCRGANVSDILKGSGMEDVRRGINMTLGCYPVKVKQFLIVGANTWLRYGFQMVSRGLLSAKNSSRFLFFDDVRGLSAHIEPSHLPRELGGTFSQIGLDDWWNSWVRKVSVGGFPERSESPALSPMTGTTAAG